MIGLQKPSDVDLASGAAQRLPRVNLPPIEVAVRRHLRRVQLGLAGLVVLAVLLVAVLFVGATGGVSDANSDVQAAAARQSALQRDASRYRDVTATYKRVADAQAMLVLAMGTEVRYSRLLSELALSVPADVWVSQVTFAQGTAAAAAAGTASAPSVGTVTFTGVAKSHDDVALWLDSLAAQPALSGPLLQNETEALLGGKKVVNFSSTANLSPAALSGRYLTAGG